MKISHPLLFRLVGILASKLITLLHLTSKIHYEDEAIVKQFHHEGKQVIYSFWHGKLLVPAYTHRHRKIRILISPHRDGEYITQVVQRLGFLPVRGSSNRGATRALNELKDDSLHDIAFTIDGPRGPRHQITTRGILAIAQHFGWPILPGGIALSRKWKLKSWDQFEIPKPFCHLYLKVDEPLFVPKEATDLEPYQKLLQERMDRVGQMVDRLVGDLEASESPSPNLPKQNDLDITEASDGSPESL